MNRKLSKKKIVYFILLVIVLTMICFIQILIYCHVDMNKRRRDSFVSSYTESSKVSYQVNMSENEYMTKNEYGKSDSYILKYTDNILFNFSYDYLSSNNINTRASYKIIANVIGSYKRSTNDTEEIYNKDFVLDKGEVDSSERIIHLEKRVDIDINKYNSILKALQDDLKLPLSGNLLIYMIVDTYDDNNTHIDSYKQEVGVTLLSDIYKVDITENEPRVRNFYSDDLEINYVYLVSLGFIFVILVVIFMVLIKCFLQKKMTKGMSLAKKYLRVYDDFIVNINDLIDESKYEVVKIDEFKELLTLANNNSTSILYILLSWQLSFVNVVFSPYRIILLLNFNLNSKIAVKSYGFIDS